MTTKQASRFLDPNPTNPLTRALIRQRAKVEPSPIFDSLNTVEFWAPQFETLSHKQLRAKARAVGLRLPGSVSTVALRALLIAHFVREVEEMSHGRSN